MDRAEADRVRGRLFALLSGFDDRLSERDTQLIHEFIEVGEWALPIEQMADVLAEADQALTDHERAEMLALVQEMGMDDRVPRVMEHCPRPT